MATDINLRDIKSRREMIRLFDGLSVERMDELAQKRLKRPVVKTYLLEMVTETSNGSSQQFGVLSRPGRIQLRQVEDGLFLLSDEYKGDMGFIEKLGDRVAALYSIAKADELGRWVGNLVQSSAEVDHVWLSGITFGVLWDVMTKLVPSYRYTRLGFRHESIYDFNNEPQVDPESDDELEEEEEPDKDDFAEISEQRAATFKLTDKIRVVQERLTQLQQLYSPLYAINQLRFPSGVGRGGHDFYDNGRVTNRSDSFVDHRNHVAFMVDIYEQLLRLTEDSAWYSVKEIIHTPAEFGRIVGSPVIIKFQEPLSPKVFETWMESTFGKKRNRFRLWGHPIKLGPCKYHVYGVDCHLWQPIILEFTNKGCTAVLPSGTCGNTVHRLVTNTQRYLDPGASAFIGDQPYGRLVEESTKGAQYGRGT